MGIEVKLQAIPENCILLQLAQTNYKVTSWIWGFPRIKETGSRYPNYAQTEERAELDSLALQCIKDNLGIEERNFWGNRRHDQILYLLSPRRRNWDDNTEDNSLFNIAIHGEKKLHPEDYTYYISPPTVEIIAHFMQSVALDEMRKHFDEEDMIKHVYKFGKGSSLEMIWTDFVEMRDVYVSASEHNEAMLTKMD